MVLHLWVELLGQRFTKTRSQSDLSQCATLPIARSKIATESSGRSSRSERRHSSRRWIRSVLHTDRRSSILDSNSSSSSRPNVSDWSGSIMFRTSGKDRRSRRGGKLRWYLDRRTVFTSCVIRPTRLRSSVSNSSYSLRGVIVVWMNSINSPLRFCQTSPEHISKDLSIIQCARHTSIGEWLWLPHKWMVAEWVSVTMVTMSIRERDIVTVTQFLEFTHNTERQWWTTALMSEGSTYVWRRSCLTSSSSWYLSDFLLSNHFAQTLACYTPKVIRMLGIGLNWVILLISPWIWYPEHLRIRLGLLRESLPTLVESAVFLTQAISSRPEPSLPTHALIVPCIISEMASCHRKVLTVVLDHTSTGMWENPSMVL